MPNLELAALCTRTPDRLASWPRSSACSKTYHRLPRHARRSRDRRRVDRHHVGPAHRARRRRARKPASTCSWKSRSPARWPTARRSSPPAPRREGHPAGRPHLPLQPALPRRQAGDRRGQDRQDRLALLAPQHPGRVDADNPQQDRPDRRRRDPRHRPDAVVHRRPGRQRLRADGQRARPQAPRHRPDDVSLRRRRHGDAGDGLVHAGQDAVRDRRAHERSSAPRASSRSRTPSPISASLRATSSTAPTRPTGRCSTARAAAP